MGRPKGSKNKKTIALENQRIVEQHEREMSLAAGRRVAIKLPADRLEEIGNVYGALMAYYQPLAWRLVQRADGKVERVNENPNYDEARFDKYAEKAKQAFAEVAPYRQPRLSAVAVGQVTKKTVTVVGGLPPRKLAPPAPVVALVPKKDTDAA